MGGLIAVMIAVAIGIGVIIPVTKDAISGDINNVIATNISLTSPYIDFAGLIVPLIMVVIVIAIVSMIRSD